MAQRYERISANDDEDPAISPSRSPPPSFRSRASSINAPDHPHNLASERQGLISDADRTLADTFDSPSDDESDDGNSPHLDDRQRVMSGRPQEHDSAHAASDGRSPIERRVTQIPAFSRTASNRPHGGGNSVNDGVFANLSAKPERGDDDLEEKPPTYEQAAADAAPPYWETTILTPGGASPDDVFIDGLPVGSFFSFIWNGLISMSFQLVGFLLTYLLHTTHAAKNGSKAGLGITLIQYGFSMKRTMANPDPGYQNPDETPGGGGDDFVPPPQDPNSHDFDPNAAANGAMFVANSAANSAPGGMKATDWFAYALMIVGWFILIRAVSQYFKARRHEQLVLQSPSRGLNIPVVAEHEHPEQSV